jgi:hypothetical protein
LHLPNEIHGVSWPDDKQVSADINMDIEKR